MKSARTFGAAMIAAMALTMLPACESTGPEGGDPPVGPAGPAQGTPTLDAALEDAVNRLLGQAKAEKAAGGELPEVWGLTPVVKRPSDTVFYEDGRTLQITHMIEEKLMTAPLRSEIAFSLVEVKETARLLGRQKIQFSDLYRDDGDMAPGQFVRARVFLLGSITGAENDHFSLALVDATTRAKYAQVNAAIPPDPTKPPDPLSLTVRLRAEPIEGRPTIAPARDLHDGVVVHSGESMATLATLSERAYLYVFIRFSQGDVYPVFPAPEGSIFHAPGAPQNPIPAGRPTSIPADQFSYAWDDHPGEEVVLFIASRHPLPDLDACVKKLVAGADLSTSKAVWDETLAGDYFARGVAGVVKTKAQQGGQGAAVVEFSSQGRFVGGKVMLRHE